MPLSSPPPPPPAAYAAATQPEAAIVVAINRARRQHGLPTVSMHVGLTTIARRHSRRMLKVDVLTHAPALRTRVRGARRSGETLAWLPQGTRSDAATVVQLWLNSPGHRAVLLDGRLRRVGIGRVLGALGSQRGRAVTADFSS